MDPKLRISSKTFIISSFLISVVVLILIGTFTYSSANKYEQATEWVNHTQKIIQETQKIFSGIQDMETSSRGYAITADENFLIPYKRTDEDINLTFLRLKYLTRDNAFQQNNLNKLKPFIDSKIAKCNEMNFICKKISPAAAQEMIKSGIGRKLTERIRPIIFTIINNEKILLEDRLKTTKHQFSSTIFWIVISIIFSCIVIMGSLIYFVVDFNKRLRMEQQLVESEIKIKKFLESLPVGVFVIKGDGQPYYANSKGTEILGNGIIPGTDLTEMPEVYKIFKAGENNSYPVEELPIVRALHGEHKVVVEDLEILKNGKRVPLRVNANPITDTEGKVLYAIASFEDITELKISEKKLLEAKLIAEQSVKLKNAFLANTSHEIRTPMNAIIGFTDLLINHKLGDLESEYVRTIKKSAENLLTIINDILDFSKIEAGMMSFEEQPISIMEIFQSLEFMLKPKAREKGLELIFIPAPDIPSLLLGDTVRLSQIIINLSSNAIKFTKKGRIKVTAKVLKQENQTTVIEFSVEDTGIGITENQLPYVFERFRQAEGDTTRQYGGTGLGLSISKQLINLMGGYITVKSIPGLGSVFIFTLPFKTPTGTVKKNPKREENRIDMKALAQLHILVVEDHPVNTKFIDSLFKENGLTCVFAENGRVALEKFQSESFDLILMDIEMPEMNGYETAAYIRTQFKSTVPILAMTANAMAGEKEKCLHCGMNDYLSKPINALLLFAKMDALTQGKARVIPDSIDLEHVSISNSLTNLQALYQDFGRSNGVVRDILDVLIRQTQLDRITFNELLEQNDYLGLSATAHKMKSSASLVGLYSMQALLAEIEMLAKEGHNPDRIRTLAIEIDLIWSKALRELENV